MSDSEKTIEAFVAERNEAKLLFTPGPASLLAENISGLRPCFGRGDADYAAVEDKVLQALRTMSGHDHIARMQGSASLALEIASLNFLYGRVLVVSTGYYSDRLQWLAESASRRTGAVKEVKTVAWNELQSVSGTFDWLVACYTETSRGLLVPMPELMNVSARTGAKILLDATASFGLEAGHDRAAVVVYSSCKGLFGLTGASFISFNELPAVEVDSFYLRLQNHLEKRMTGPYHAIQSLLDVLPRHADFRAAVVENKDVFMKRMRSHLTMAASHQPLLCTQVDVELTAADARAILYQPRGSFGGSVVCHLGEVHLGIEARGEILDALDAGIRE